MGVRPLKDDEIKIGKFTGNNADIVGNIVQVGGNVFTGKCPLWTYVLAETEEVDIPVNTMDGEKRIKTRRLGPVGGRIVAETMVGIIAGDRNSYLNLDPLWKPQFADEHGCFGLRQLVRTALQG